MLTNFLIGRIPTNEKQVRKTSFANKREGKNLKDVENEEMQVREVICIRSVVLSDDFTLKKMLVINEN